MVGGVLYTTTSLSQVAAIDAATGQTRWVFDPKVSRTARYPRQRRLGAPRRRLLARRRRRAHRHAHRHRVHDRARRQDREAGRGLRHRGPGRSHRGPAAAGRPATLHHDLAADGRPRRRRGRLVGAGLPRAASVPPGDVAASTSAPASCSGPSTPFRRPASSATRRGRRVLETPAPPTSGR